MSDGPIIIDYKMYFSLENIRMTASSYETYFAAFDSINQQPIGVNMTLPAVL